MRANLNGKMKLNDRVSLAVFVFLKDHLKVLGATLDLNNSCSLNLTSEMGKVVLKSKMEKFANERTEALSNMLVHWK